MDIVNLLSYSALGISIVASIVFAFRKKNAATSKIQIVVGTYNFFCGLLILLLSSCHFIVILSEIFLGKTLSDRIAFSYNFRFYSLLLLGAILIFLSCKLLKCSVGILNRDLGSLKSAINALLFLLAINIPLVPIQGFATAFVIFCTINLILLFAYKKQFH